MKKLFAIVLAVVMVLSVASMAMAFEWAKPAEPADKFGYKIEVIKMTSSTAAYGSASFNVDGNATAVNGAPVYYTIKLTVPDLSKDSGIRQNAKADVVFTSISGVETIKSIELADLEEGVYYFYQPVRDAQLTGGVKVTGYSKKNPETNGPLTAQPYVFQPVSAFRANILGINYTAETPAYAKLCEDTDTAKVYAKVYSDRPFAANSWFNVGPYDVAVATSTVVFKEAADKAGTGTTVATFHRNADDKVTKVDSVVGGQELTKLYKWLNNDSADAIYAAIDKGEMYMTDANLRTAFGFTYKVESSITWKANSTPIILDPTVTIPKTGDNASVIGFAMIMVAVVAAAVAVKKVKA